MRGLGVVLIVSLALGPPVRGEVDPGDKPTQSNRELFEELVKKHGATTPAEQFQALCREYDGARERYERAMREAKSDEERRRARNESYTHPSQYTLYFKILAQLHPKDPAAQDALIWNASHDPSSVEAEEAMIILARDHVDSDKLGPACDAVGYVPFVKSETFLRTVVEKSPHREVRARAAFGLARILKRWFDYAEDLANAESPRGRKMAEFFGEPVAGRIRKDPQAIAKEAERLLEQVRETAGDARYREGSLAEAAARTLGELRDLVVGKPAPEIVGNDLDGRPMKLSDFRGRVVVVSFWATWCGPCMELVPHERNLVKGLEGKPFVLLGVNGDDDRDKARQAAGHEQMTWQSWWDGGVEGPTAARWNVRGWPTIYVIDREGIIRYKRNEALGLESVEKAVAKLLE